MTAGPEWHSFVGGLLPLCVGEALAGNTGEKTRRGDTVSQHPCYWYLLCRVDRIVRLSPCRAKTIKGRSEQKAKYLIYKQKIGK